MGFEVTETEFAALDALAEIFRQLAYLELDEHRHSASTMLFAMDGTATLSLDRAAAISRWLRTVRGQSLDNPDVPIAACWVLAWGRGKAAPLESEHPHMRMPGSFTVQLLEAIQAADAINRAKIARGFPVLVDAWELWMASEWAELHRRADAAGGVKPRATTVRNLAPPGVDLDELSPRAQAFLAGDELEPPRHPSAGNLEGGTDGG